MSTPAPFINLDGKLDEVLWSRSKPVTDFVIQPAQASLAKTTAWLATDETYLYLAARCEEPRMDLLASYEYPRDGSIWRNDCIELFIAPGEAQGEYFHIVMDAAGQVYDAWVQDKNRTIAYDLPVAVGTHEEDTAWTLEAAIPLSGLQIQHGQKPRICIGRERKTVFEFSAWNGWFNQPTTWQPVDLPVSAEYSFNLKSLDFGERKYGLNSFGAEFTASSTGEIKLIQELSENGIWKIAETRTVQISARQPQEVRWDYILSPGKEYSAVGYRALSNGKVISSARCRVELPAQAIAIRLPTPYLFSNEKSSRVRLTTSLSARSLQEHSAQVIVKNPAGRVLSTRRIATLPRSAIFLTDFSGWETGAGSLEVQLLDANGRIVTSESIVVSKRPGPFS